MILTETLFRKIISFAAPQETQFHTDVMAQASAVLKRAHKRGVELEYILEVRLLMRHLPSSRPSRAGETDRGGRTPLCLLVVSCVTLDLPGLRSTCCQGLLYLLLALWESLCPTEAVGGHSRTGLWQSGWRTSDFCYELLRQTSNDRKQDFLIHDKIKNLNLGISHSRVLLSRVAMLYSRTSLMAVFYTFTSAM